jgi:hypothetical protein
VVNVVRCIAWRTYVTAEDGGVGGYISGAAAVGKTAVQGYAIGQVEGNIAGIGGGDGCATCIGF